MTERWVQVAPAGALVEGAPLVVVVEGRPVAIRKVAGELFAISNVCAHRQGPVGEGEIVDRIIECPLHGWRYDLVTGRCVGNPASKIDVYDVRLSGGALELRARQ